MTSTATSTSAVPPVVIPASGNNIIISPLQRGNPVLECIRNVGTEYGDIVADYQVGRTTGVLFLSLKYHRLHPEYVHTRIEKLGHSYNLRILLILCDITEHREHIRELTRICLHNNITVIVAFSSDEVGHYLSTFKQFEHKPPDLIKERIEKDYNSILRAALTSISKVNKTDVETLRTSFGSFANISHASADQLQNLPGFGQVKVKNIKNAFDKPFRNNTTTSLSTLASQRQSSKSKSSNTVTDGDQPIASSSGQRSRAPVIDKARQSEPSTSNFNSRPPRTPSPVWDIELDLDEVDEIGPPPSPRPPQTSTQTSEKVKHKGPPSVEFDIDLDLT